MASKTTSQLGSFTGTFANAIFMVVDPDVVDVTLRNKKITGAEFAVAVGGGGGGGSVSNGNKGHITVSNSGATWNFTSSVVSAFALTLLDDVDAASVRTTLGLGFAIEATANKGIANGYAPLDGGAKIPAAYLPSYVDDVLEFANLASFPAIGEAGKIYVALDTLFQYRWGGSVYARLNVSSGPVGGPMHVAIIGDSITVADASGSDKVNPSVPINRNSQASGIMTWALTLSGQRVTLPQATNVWSFPGKETDVILAQLPAFLAQLPVKPGAVVIEVGTNNLFRFGLAQETFAFITADYTSIAALLTAQGIRTIFIPILPRGAGFSALLPPASFATMDRCNRWLREFAANSNGMVAVASRCLLPMTDPTSAADQVIPKANLMVDNTHPGPGGGYLVGLDVSDILNTWSPPVDLLPVNNFRNAASYPDANVLTNSAMIGTAGGINAPVTGQAPTSWNVGAVLPAGVKCVTSVVTGADGIRRTQFVFSGKYTVTGAPAEGAGFFARLYQQVGTADAALIAAGDTLEALCDFEIDAGHSCFLSPRLQFRTRAAIENNAMYPQIGFLPLGLAIKGVLRTAPHTYAAAPGNSETGLFAMMHLPSSNGTYSVYATIRVGRPIIRKVS